MLASLVLASQTFVLPHNEYQLEQLEHSLLSIAVASMGFIVICGFLRGSLPRAGISACGPPSACR